MIVVTVARKPLASPTVAENTLRIECGGLDVDGSRIATSESLLREHARDGTAIWGKGTVAGTYGSTEGRWPANLLLSHLPGCRETGGTTTFQRGVPGGYQQSPDRSSGFLAGIGKPTVGRTTEYVSVWACEPGCPVADMDRRSGESSSSPREVTIGQPRAGLSGMGSFTLSSGSNHKDRGGASRFFKKV